MALSESQQKFIISKIKEKLRPPSLCPGCGVAVTWGVDAILELREFNEGNLILGGPVTPLLPVACQNCGYTQLFNAIKLELVDRNTGKLIYDQNERS